MKYLNNHLTKGILFLSLLYSYKSCNFRTRISLEPIIEKYELENQYDSLGNRIGIMKKKIIETPFRPYAITFQSHKKKIVEYILEGNYSSSGLNATALKSISDSSIIKNDTLYVYHQVSTKQGLGKEGAYIIGYNFRKEKSIKIPNSVRKLKIEMIEIRSPSRRSIVSEGGNYENPFLHKNQKVKSAQLVIDL